jgi:hypothetical protein
VPLLVFTERCGTSTSSSASPPPEPIPSGFDRGEARRVETCWNDFGFGALNESAKVRHEVVEQIIARLAIADRCERKERYLVVRGELHTHRIHLGERQHPDVPERPVPLHSRGARRPCRQALPPLRHDRVLSLILGKAFRLAGDTEIKDRTILAQINGS